MNEIVSILCVAVLVALPISAVITGLWWLYERLEQ